MMRDVAAFREVLEFPESPKVVCVDMPIGLPEHTPTGGRACEGEARAVLGPRKSSVFSVVGRKALACSAREDAHAVSVAGGGIGVGAQTWGLVTKLIEIDKVISKDLQMKIFEVHPELCFWAMNNRQPMAFGKKKPAGQSDRRATLSRSGVPTAFLDKVDHLPSGQDDFLDACAAAWAARRILNGVAERFLAILQRDSRGLDMAMWF